MYRRWIFVPGVALLCAAGLAAQNPGGNPEAAKLKNPVAADAASLSAGEELYALNCQFCHGPKGQGDGLIAPPDTPNIADGEWKHGSTDGEIFTVIQKGIGPAFTMPPHEDRMSETDIWHIVNYVRTLGPPDAKR